MCEVDVKCTLGYRSAEGKPVVERIVPGPLPTQIIRIVVPDHDVEQMTDDLLARRVAETVLARNDYFGLTRGSIAVDVGVHGWQRA